MIFIARLQVFVASIQIVLLLFLPSACNKKVKELNPFDIKYDLHTSDQLPSDTQVNTFLETNQRKIFYYNSNVENGALSATITSCSSPVRWSFSKNSTTDNNNFITTTGLKTKQYHSTIGTYKLILEAESSTYVHIYISTEIGGPQALQNIKNHQKLRLIRRQRRKLTIRWDPSLVDPQGTDYCLVVSQHHHYDTLCTAHADLIRSPIRIIGNNDQRKIIDPFIICVGRKTHYILNDLKQGQNYYFNLFAINRQSNLTYPYGRDSITFTPTIKPYPLKDAKSNFANLKKHDGKVVFRYKIGKKSGKTLDLFIMPCGGAVDVEITLKGKTIIQPRRIESFGRITINNPIIYGRYNIKIFSINHEELRKTSGVEIYATTKNLSKIPLPNMPKEFNVKEYTTMRTCESVTVGWVAAPTIQKNSLYCLIIKEGKIRDMEDYRMPNQCGLENRLKKSADFAMEYCMNVKQEKEGVLTRTITQLKPGRNYIVQVTVKKPKGKTLSYDLLQVHTNPTCRQNAKIVN